MTCVRIDNSKASWDEVGVFVIASGMRKIQLLHTSDVTERYPWAIVVWSTRTNKQISCAYYAVEELARADFENRRPHMRDAANEPFEGPMQKGKRLVQTVFDEKLGLFKGGM